MLGFLGIMGSLFFFGIVVTAFIVVAAIACISTGYHKARNKFKKGSDSVNSKRGYSTTAHKYQSFNVNNQPYSGNEARRTWNSRMGRYPQNDVVEVPIIEVTDVPENQK